MLLLLLLLLGVRCMLRPPSLSASTSSPSPTTPSWLKPLYAHVNRFWDSRLTNTQLMHAAADSIRIRPPWNAPRWFWSLAWKVQKAMMGSVLHAFDRCAPKDSNLNLAVLWWKAMAGNRLGSPTYDGGVAHDLLPHVTRNVVAFPFCYLYPPLHHQTVAMRTAFLDASLDDVCRQLAHDDPVRVIVLGGGFDTRSLRYLLGKQARNIDFYEIDLPSVVTQKQRIFERFLRRRPGAAVPRLLGADLNDLDQVKSQLAHVFQHQHGGTRPPLTVYMVEAVLMYLKQDTVLPLLASCMEEAARHGSNVKFVFADRLPGMPYDDKDPSVERMAAEKVLKVAGLRLDAWQGKPGRARHMGIATYQPN